MAEEKKDEKKEEKKGPEEEKVPLLDTSDTKGIPKAFFIVGQSDHNVG